MNQTAQFRLERQPPYRVWLSWNGGQSWWEILPEMYDGDTFTPPVVIKERFRDPQG